MNCIYLYVQTVVRGPFFGMRAKIPSSHPTLADCKVLVSGGEYKISDVISKQHLKGYGLDYDISSISECKELTLPTKIQFSKVQVMIVTTSSSEKYCRISFLLELENYRIKTLIFDSPTPQQDIRDAREEYVLEAIQRQVYLIIHVVNNKKINFYERSFERFLKKAHQIVKPELLTRVGNTDKFNVYQENQDHKVSFGDYVRKAAYKVL
jgi:hypothetical protein